MTSRKSWSCTTTSACSRRSPNHCGDFRLRAKGHDRDGISGGFAELHGAAPTAGARRQSPPSLTGTALRLGLPGARNYGRYLATVYRKPNNHPA